MEKLYIVMPAYNESNNIQKCVDDWYRIVELHNKDKESRLVIIDDGSMDNTFDILTDLSKKQTVFNSD